LPPFQSHDHALAEIDRVLTQVEDEHSGVERDPSGMPAVTAGRMYPPHPASAKECDLPGVVLYVQKGHFTYIGERGAVLICNRKTRTVEFEKERSDGGRIQP
jgi:hypothetical protein